MSMNSETTKMIEEIHEIFNRLTHGEGEERWQAAQRLAENMEPHDHWLQTGKLDPAMRLFLSAAAALSMYSLKENPYKCAVLTRELAESMDIAR